MEPTETFDLDMHGPGENPRGNWIKNPAERTKQLSELAKLDEEQFAKEFFSVLGEMPSPGGDIEPDGACFELPYLVVSDNPKKQTVKCDEETANLELAVRHRVEECMRETRCRTTLKRLGVTEDMLDIFKKELCNKNTADPKKLIKIAKAMADVGIQDANLVCATIGEGVVPIASRLVWNPHDAAEMYFQLARVYASQGAKRETNEALRRSLTLEESEPKYDFYVQTLKSLHASEYLLNAYLLEVDYLKKRGEYKKALAVLEQAIQDFPSEPNLYLQAAQLLTTLNDKEMAAQFRQRALDLMDDQI